MGNFTWAVDVRQNYSTHVQRFTPAYDLTHDIWLCMRDTVENENQQTAMQERKFLAPAPLAPQDIKCRYLSTNVDIPARGRHSLLDKEET